MPERVRTGTDRFTRQRRLAGVGVEGQRRLRGARALVVGLGGLGAPIVQYLAGAGMGSMRLVDGDSVALHNLHRQVLFTAEDVGVSKATAAAAWVARLDRAIAVEAVDSPLNEENVGELVADCDVVLDATDDWAAARILDEACAAADVPLVWGSVLGWHGQLSVFGPGAGRSRLRLEHLYPADAPTNAGTCATEGVLGPLCGTIGSAMAAEAVKLITGAGTALIGRLVVHDALDGTWAEVPFDLPPRTDGSNDLAGQKRRIRPPRVADVAVAAATGHGESVVSDIGLASGGGDRAAGAVTARQAAALVADGAVTLVDVREHWEREIAAIDGTAWAPLATVLDGVATLPEGVLLVHCHHDTRSRMAADALRRAGRDVRWVVGGIDAWAVEVDPRLARY